MKQFFFFFIFFISFDKTFSQNQNNTWYFGVHGGLDFNTDPPTPIYGYIYTDEGCATMCDNSGHILFYSNGISIWNRNNQVMQNGDGLLGAISATQSVLIVPKPLDNNVYYVFTVPQVFGANANPLSYSIVDMTLAGGLGAVTIKNVPLHMPVTEKLTATFKSNDIDYWIIAKEADTDAFLVYSLTSGGLNPTPIISHAGISTTAFEIGYARVSPNGLKLCLADYASNMAQLFDFNNSTGIVSNPVDLPMPASGNPYGVEFSPDNSKLYVMVYTGYVLLQYDLLAGSPAAIQNSVIQIVPQSSATGGAMLLGPDGKIYICDFNRPYLSVIDKPNLAGIACNYIHQAVSLVASTYNVSGLPNNIHSAIASCPAIQNVSSNVTICSNQTYQLPSGTIVNTSGAYLDTIRNHMGSCDSIITTINLSINPVSFVTTAVQVCSNQTYTLPSGTIVSVAGIYIDTLRSVAGCDSIITTTTLSLFPVNHISTAVQVCAGQTYTLPSGTIVNTIGVYIDTLRSVASCDSVITATNLSVITASLMNTAVQVCSNQTYTLPSGTIVSTTGTYIDTLRSVIGCDSVITHLTLSVFPVNFLNTEVHICSNETYHLPSGTIVHAAGIYIDTLRSVSFCDSIINTIHVFVNDASGTSIGDSIYSGQTYMLPSGETVSAAGVYQSILLNSAGCDSVITTTLKLKQQIAECITLKNAFTPNGDGINDYWVLYRYNCFKRLKVNVYNRYGSLVYHSDDYKNDWNGKFKNKELPDGTYYYIIKIISFDGKEHLFKDNVTILR